MFLNIRSEEKLPEKKERAKLEKLKTALQSADAVMIGAGAGLSASAGYTYQGARFRKYFSDFAAEYGIPDMYAGGFYSFSSPAEFWAYWSRYIYINRYMDPPEPVYSDLYALVRNRDYFVLTTNVDHCFQKAGFSRQRLFYTQGDYGLFQCSDPCRKKTYENADTIRAMVLAQGFRIDAQENLEPPEDGMLKMQVPEDLIPRCPECGKPLTVNLRSDDTFVEDTGWEQAAQRYSGFIRQHENLRMVYLELGVGYNTPAIIKFPFWRMTAANPQSLYVCINQGEAACPRELAGQSICLNADIRDILEKLLKMQTAGSCA